jgi:putative aminopeptidase
MNRHRSAICGFSCFILSCSICILAANYARAQSAGAGLDQDLSALVDTPAVSGYEQDLARHIGDELKTLHPTVDNLGDVLVTVGSGSPHRLLVAPMDEPGFVVSGITDDGYLRLQRLPQFGILPMFEELYAAQPVRLETASGKYLTGIVAGLSVHLQPGRQNPPNPGELREMYLDVGASSADEARRAGADILSPVAIDRHFYRLSSGLLASPAIGDRFGDAVLIELLRGLDPSKLRGTLTVAFVVQQWTGARGLERVLTTVPADELIYVGRLRPSGPIPAEPKLHKAPRLEPGSGVLIGLQETGESLTGFAAEVQKLAADSNIPVAVDYAAPLMPPSYLPGPKLPDKSIHLGIATAWPSTPAEEISARDLANLQALLAKYLDIPYQASGSGGGAGSGSSGLDRGPGRLSVEDYLRELVETYGASNHEGDVRDKIKTELPGWAKTETDDAGNLILHWGSDAGESKGPRIIVMAHMDEIGFEVKSIAKDGRLDASWLGGGELSYYAGHEVLVHSSNGVHEAVMELPMGWDQADFKWPAGRDAVIHVDVGARSPEEVSSLGIKPGDWITIPKKYRKLLGTRANGRSFDDRVGCASLVSAVWAIGPNLKDRDVAFVWSTGEELGLVGAGAMAKRLAAEGHEADYVFAIDTFVSSDSPIEDKWFADAPLGKGFVIRAVDNSNIVRRDLVDKLLALAKSNQVPVQYGATGGGNDGSAFLRYGSADIAIGWPLRYSHSPGEVIDTRDAESLARIVAAIAKTW